MTRTIDTISRELEWLDPVYPGELDGRGSDELLAWILSLEVGPADRAAHEADRRRGPGRRWASWIIPVSALAALGAAALALAIGMPGGGASHITVGTTATGSLRAAGPDPLAGTLERAATVARAPRAQAVSARQYTYRKTGEVALDTTRRDGRSWSVYARTTREEWVAWDGSGLLRVATEPTRFAAPADRAAWRAAGSPAFLALGFSGHTEDHWLAAGMLDRSFEQLPTAPAALAARLARRAAAHHGNLSVAAATLEGIAADLGEPGASPELRGALYEALGRVPGIRYLGTRTDPRGRRGTAVGVRGTYDGRPALFSLIFDSDSATVLATETTATGLPGSAAGPGPRLLHARTYLESRGIDSAADAGDVSLAKFDIGSQRQLTTPYLVYRIPTPNHWSQTIDASFEGGSRG